MLAYSLNALLEFLHYLDASAGYSWHSDKAQHVLLGSEPSGVF
jgi:hypothetical protein